MIASFIVQQEIISGYSLHEEAYLYIEYVMCYIALQGFPSSSHIWIYTCDVDFYVED